MALEAHLKRGGHEVSIWSFVEHTKENIARVIEFGEIIINATPVFAIRETFSGQKLNGKLLISIAKGIEKACLPAGRDTQKLPHQIFQDLGVSAGYIALSGPSFAQEVANGLPTAVMLGSKDGEALKIVKNLLASDNLKIETTADILGLELCGALKNVLAIAAGIGAGAGMNKNYQAVAFVKGLEEIAALGQKLGAKRETFYSLAGIGDLFLSSTNKESRNFSFGFGIGQGKSVDEARAGNTVEGMGTTESVYVLVQKFALKLPIFKNIYEVVFKSKNPKEALEDIWAGI